LLAAIASCCADRRRSANTTVAARARIEKASAKRKYLKWRRPAADVAIQSVNPPAVATDAARAHQMHRPGLHRAGIRGAVTDHPSAGTRAKFSPGVTVVSYL